MVKHDEAEVGRSHPDRQAIGIPNSASYQGVVVQIWVDVIQISLDLARHSSTPGQAERCSLASAWGGLFTPYGPCRTIFSSDPAYRVGYTCFFRGYTRQPRWVRKQGQTLAQRCSGHSSSSVRPDIADFCMMCPLWTDIRWTYAEFGSTMSVFSQSGQIGANSDHRATSNLEPNLASCGPNRPTPSRVWRATVWPRSANRPTSIGRIAALR